MNCDSIARAYRFFEYSAFGRRLEKHRFHFLQACTGSRRALLLGDGDGRFGLRLAGSNPGIQIDSVELSAKMLEHAQSRVADARIVGPSRIDFLHADALTVDLPDDHYDLVVTNFFFDCFTDDEVDIIVKRVARACRSDARWIVSEFCQPSSGWRAWHAQLWLAVMYAFFRVATSLKTTRLPDHHAAMRRAGFGLSSSSFSMANFVCSELWLRSR